MGGGSNADDFYTSASARQAYKNHLKVVTSRKNTINGKVTACVAFASEVADAGLAWDESVSMSARECALLVRHANVSLLICPGECI